MLFRSKVHERIETLGERIKGAERAFNDLVASAENHLLVPARKMGKLGAPTGKELTSNTPVESEVRTIRSIENSSNDDEELDFTGGGER